MSASGWKKGGGGKGGGQVVDGYERRNGVGRGGGGSGRRNGGGGNGKRSGGGGRGRVNGSAGGGAVGGYEAGVGSLLGICSSPSSSGGSSNESGKPSPIGWSSGRPSTSASGTGSSGAGSSSGSSGQPSPSKLSSGQPSPRMAPCKTKWFHGLIDSELPVVEGIAKRGWKGDKDGVELSTVEPDYSAQQQLAVSGRTVNVITNHWLINIKLPKSLYRYEVAVQMEKVKSLNPAQEKKPKLPSKRGTANGGAVNKALLSKLMQVLAARLRSRTPGAGIITDFSRILISTEKLEPSALYHKLSHSELPYEDDSNRFYYINLTEATFTVDLNRVQSLIRQDKIIDHPDLVEMKQVYNILMKNLGMEDYVPLGGSSLLKRSLPTEDNYLGQGIMNWKGASLVCTLGATWKPFLNVEIHNSAFLIGQSVVDAIAEILAKWNPRNNSSRRFTEDDFRLATNVAHWKEHDADNVLGILKLCKVRRNVNGKKMDSRLDGICGFGSDRRNDRLARKIMFDYNGRQISVENYFGTVLKKPLKYPDGPVLKLGKACVPAEFCMVKAGQSINRLPGNTQRKMLAVCTEKPQVKAGHIQRTVQDLGLTSDLHPLLSKFGISFPGTKEMHKLPNTRVLAPPELCYGMGPGSMGARAKITPVDGAWDIWSHSIQFYEPAVMTEWVVVGVGLRNKLDRNTVERFGEIMAKEGYTRGMSFPPFPPHVIDIRLKWDSRGDGHYKNVALLIREFNEIKANFTRPKNSIIICVIPPKPNQQYSIVKQAAERLGGAGVLTQCVQDKNFDKCDYSIIKNILLKINTKLGGVNHVPLYPESTLSNVSILKVPTLIIGIDVNHPSLPIEGRPVGFPSFASVTGSLDRTGIPYMMHVQAQIRLANKVIGSAEVVENLDVIVKKMMIDFKVKSKTQPQRIIVFRDGVGETQFPEILQKEMMKIRKACSDLNPDYKPPITFIAVQKRHKVRFFLDAGNGRIGKENVPPGTVVDKDIVSQADYYLLSHKGMLGTSRPTHYHILWDDSDFTFNEIQCLSYFLCHNYSRCNRTVSYPTPTYYAHLAALRAKELANGYRDWTGDQASLDKLNLNLIRSEAITSDFPMHFI